MGRIRACGHWRIPDRAIRRQRSMGRADCGVFVWVLRIEQEASAGLFIRPPDVRNGVLAVTCDWIHFVWAGVTLFMLAVRARGR